MDGVNGSGLRQHMNRSSQTICTQVQALCASCPLPDVCLRRLENLTALKALLNKPEFEQTSTRTPLGHCEVDLCLNGGLQHGVLHEVLSATGHETAATGFVVGLVTRVSAGKHALWIRQDFSTHEFGELSPIGLLELGFNPAHMFLLSVANASDGLRAANDALTCAALGSVVIEIAGNPKALDLMASRRLTLAATRKSVTVFLLRFNAQAHANTAETRWLVRGVASQTQNEDWGHPAFEVDLMRNRHGKMGHWFMGWNCNGRVFQSSSADPGTVVSKAAN